MGSNSLTFMFPGERGDSHMKGAGKLVGNFELNP